jgi:hypothetical protein
MRRLSNERGLEIVRQGAAQFGAMFEESACPFKIGTQDVERKLWTKGFVEARVRWFQPVDAKNRFKKFVKRPFVKK